LSLPDGTKVWLNAASSIRFPTAFTSEKREVKVTGEAYFEVTRNAKAPFLLIVNDTAEVQILGTHFNVNAYPDEHLIKTTLFEGSVKVGWLGNKGVILKPGQQAGMQQGKEIQAPGIKVTNLDASTQESVLAWKNGFFNFEGATLAEIMRQVARWYDIDVEFEKGVQNIEFVGEMSRDASFSDFLVALDKSEIHYKLEGRKLTIKP
jgi:ferric-dicitrate binding protein FerR (iron transport regulator)